MKVVKVERNGKVAGASVSGETVQILTAWSQGDPLSCPFDLPRLSRTELESRARTPQETLGIGDVKLLPPLTRSSKVVCLGLNYAEHANEGGVKPPPNPALFIKVTDTFVGQHQPIVRPRISTRFDYEGEIAVIIGRGGRHISKADALNHVFGYTILMDGSIRDYQEHSISAGKCVWRTSACGPWIVTADEIPDPTVMSLATRLNGQVVQSAQARNMIYDIPTAIEYISRWTPLEPGDVISTGTPNGVGAARTPPLWMKPGDSLEIEVSPIGILANPVIDDE